MLSSSKISYMEASVFSIGRHWHAPIVQSGEPGSQEHYTRAPGAWKQTPNTWNLTQMRLAHGSRRLAPVPCGSRRCFVTFWWWKPGILAQVQVETLPINTTFLIHNFSYRTKRFKRKSSTRSFQGRSLSLLNPSFSRVYFISFVICL